MRAGMTSDGSAMSDPEEPGSVEESVTWMLLSHLYFCTKFIQTFNHQVFRLFLTDYCGDSEGSIGLFAAVVCRGNTGDEKVK